MSYCEGDSCWSLKGGGMEGTDKTEICHEQLVTCFSDYLPEIVSRNICSSEAQDDYNPNNESDVSVADSVFESFEPELDSNVKVYDTHACVLFADVSEFMKMTEALATFDERGIGQLAQAVNTCFSTLIKMITDFGGDIFKFCGDGLIAMWPVYDTENLERNMQTEIRNALYCASAIQKSDTLPFSFKIGMGAGKVMILHLGGELEKNDMSISNGLPRREYIGLGSAVDQAFAAERLSQVKQIILSEACVLQGKLSPEFSKHHQIDEFPFRVENIRDEGFFLAYSQSKDKNEIKSRQLYRRNNPVIAKHHICRAVNTALAGIFQSFLPEQVISEKEADVKNCVPFCGKEKCIYVDNKNEVGRVGSRYKDLISEIRQITCVFINLGLEKEYSKLNASSKNEFVSYAKFAAKLNQGFRIVQRSVMDHGGAVNKLCADEKGISVLAMFGLNSQENDASRAMFSCLQITSNIDAKIGSNVSIGVATGLAYCGVVGDINFRREYTVIGECVNVASRLMQVANHINTFTLNSKSKLRTSMSKQRKSSHNNNSPNSTLGSNANAGRYSSIDLSCFPFQVLVDNKTFELARKDIVFEVNDTMKHIYIKGKSDPVAVFSPAGVSTLIHIEGKNMDDDAYVDEKLSQMKSDSNVNIPNKPKRRLGLMKSPSMNILNKQKSNDHNICKDTYVHKPAIQRSKMKGSSSCIDLAGSSKIFSTENLEISSSSDDDEYIDEYEEKRSTMNGEPNSRKWMKQPEDNNVNTREHVESESQLCWTMQVDNYARKRKEKITNGKIKGEIHWRPAGEFTTEETPEGVSLKIRKLIETKSKQFIAIDGVTGSGRTHLLKHVYKELQKNANVVVLAVGNPFEVMNSYVYKPFGIWVDLVEQILRIYHTRKSKKTLKCVHSGIEGISCKCNELGDSLKGEEMNSFNKKRLLTELLEISGSTLGSHAWVLNDLFYIDFEVPLKVETGQGNHNNLIQRARLALMADILSGIDKAIDYTITCIIDDASYMEYLSWMVTLSGIHGLKNFAVIISTTTINKNAVMDERIVQAYASFKEMPSTWSYVLKTLTRLEVSMIARSYLKVLNVKEDLLDLLAANCNGNPLFVREVLVQMVKKSMIVVNSQYQTTGLSEIKRVNSNNILLNNAIISEPNIGHKEAAQVHINSPKLLQRGYRRKSSSSSSVTYEVQESILSPRNPMHVNHSPKLIQRGFRRKSGGSACGGINPNALPPLDNSRACNNRRSRWFSSASRSGSGLNHNETDSFNIPIKLVYILGSWIDRLPYVAQIMLKVAACDQSNDEESLGSKLSFKRQVVIQALPLDGYDESELQMVFDRLVDEEYFKPLPIAKDASVCGDGCFFTFANHFLRCMLISRLLEEQRGFIVRRLDIVKQFHVNNFQSECDEEKELLKNKDEVNATKKNVTEIPKRKKALMKNVKNRLIWGKVNKKKIQT